jgi:hypothetical protein
MFGRAFNLKFEAIMGYPPSSTTTQFLRLLGEIDRNNAVYCIYCIYCIVCWGTIWFVLESFQSIQQEQTV